MVSDKPGPPILSVSEISAYGANVQFESDHNTDDIVYSLRYKMKTGDDDDEKGSEWNEEQILDKGTNAYRLSGLERSSQYEICGRYQVLDTKIWSESSNIKSFITLAVEKLKFEWDSSRMGSDVSLLHDNKTFIYPKYDGSSRVVMSKNVLSADNYESVDWEVTIRDIDTVTSGSWQLGFVDSAGANSVTLKGAWSGTSVKPYECVLFIKEQKFYKYYKSKYTDFDEKWKGKDCKMGDKILMRFNFKTKACTIFYNGQMVGVLSDVLPNNIHVLANVARRTSLCTTRFEAIPKK